MLPLAQQHLTPADWSAIHAAFKVNEDPMDMAVGGGLAFDKLFNRIVSLAPATR